MIATISKDVPKIAAGAIPLLFNKIAHRSSTSGTTASQKLSSSDSFDWAIHPGGIAILRSAQKVMNLGDDHIQSSLNVYKSNGNSSSATVLIVLDKLRGMHKGQEDVIVTSFGPGITVEMALMRRRQFPDLPHHSTPAKFETRYSWRSLHPRLLRAYARLVAGRTKSRKLQNLRPLVQQSKV